MQTVAEENPLIKNKQGKQKSDFGIIEEYSKPNLGFVGQSILDGQSDRTAMPGNGFQS
jgi:hypothetical protein